MKHFLTNTLMFAAATLTSQSLDPTFGNGGKISTEGSFSKVATKIAPNGTIYALGVNYKSQQLGSDIVLKKFTKDGQQDLSFASNGSYIFNANKFDLAGDLLIEEDGSVVFAGYSSERSLYDIPKPWATPFVFKLDSNGTQIGGGFVNVPSDFDALHDLQVSGLAKLGNNYILAGTSDYWGNFMAIKVNPSGQLISSFGNRGAATADFNFNYDYCDDVLITDAGDILLGGYTSEFSHRSFAAALVDGNTGALKTSFGNQGTLKIKVSATGSDWADKLTKLPNGKILLTGGSDLPAIEKGVFAMASFDPQTGALDRNFDYDGKRVIFLAGKFDWCSDAAVHEGQLYLAGISQQYDYSTMPAIIRLLPNGLNDNSFGNKGIVLFEPKNGGFPFLSFQGNKPLITLNAENGGCMLMRFNPLSVPSASRIASVAADLKTEALSIYPNPVVDKVTVAFDQELLETYAGASMEIVDVYGATVLQNMVLEGNSVELSVANLQAGVYSAKVVTNTGKLVGMAKFVVQP